MHRRKQEMIAVRCLLELEAMGVRVDIVSDVRRARDLISPLRDGPGLAHDASRLLLSGANVFWALAYLDEKLILAAGVRVDDLGSDSVQEFLARSIEVIFGVNVTGVSHDVFEGRKWGRAAYFGGFTAETARGLGRSGARLIQLLAAYVHHCSFLDLGADINYSFHRGSDSQRGIPYGFLGADPFIWSTDRPMYEDGNPVWVMQLPREKLPSVLVHASNLLKETPKNQSGMASQKTTKIGEPSKSIERQMPIKNGIRRRLFNVFDTSLK